MDEKITYVFMGIEIEDKKVYDFLVQQRNLTTLRRRLFASLTAFGATVWGHAGHDASFGHVMLGATIAAVVLWFVTRHEIDIIT